MIYIGIDPGTGGGIAVTDGKKTSAVKMPDTEKDVFESLKGLLSEDPFVIIEKVGAMPGQGVTSMFSFGQSYGFLRGLLVALEIPFEEVSPQKWQKELGLLQRRRKDDAKLSKTDKKNLNKQKAQQLWPHLRVTHATADALLIAEYGRRVNANRV